MAQWGNEDLANNSPALAAAQLKVTANTANRDALFGNTTADAFVSGQTNSVVGISQEEAQAARAAGGPGKGAGPGWVLRTEGSGGRAGRITTETLVAFGGNFTGNDAADDALAPDFAIVINTQPADVSANTSTNAIFTVDAVSVPAGDTLTFAWTFANGDSIPGGTIVSGATAATLEIDTSVQTSNADYTVEIGGTGGAANVTSEAAVLTITA